MKILEVFKKTVGLCAHLGDDIVEDKKVKYKAPYKPAFMLALFTTFSDEMFYENRDCFNRWLNFKDYVPNSLEWKIIWRYYNILLSNFNVIEKIKKFSDKNMSLNLQNVFNEKTYNWLTFHAFDLPLERISKAFKEENLDFITIDKPKLLRINYSGNEVQKLIQNLIEISLKKLESTNLGFDGLKLEYVLDHGSLIESNETNSTNLTIRQIREKQYWWAKRIKDNDGKCVVCCEQIPCLLEAAHIKPFSVCEENEQYDLNNGVTLCLTHHKLFDLGYFTFKDDWTVDISNADKFKYFKDDLYLKIKVYESCYSQLSQRRMNIEKNIYLKYRKDNIYKN